MEPSVLEAASRIFLIDTRARNEKSRPLWTANLAISLITVKAPGSLIVSEVALKFDAYTSKHYLKFLKVSVDPLFKPRISIMF